MRLGPLDTASLRARLVLIPTIIVFLGLALTIVFVLSGARERVATEIQSGFRFGAMVVDDVIDELGESSDPKAAFASLAKSLPQVRHVRFAIDGMDTAGSESLAAPRWFAHLFTPKTQTRAFPVNIPGVPSATITMRSSPNDEIEEIWSEVVLLASILLAVWLAMIAVMAATIGWVLRPVHQLAQAFDALEHGGQPVLPPLAVSELRRVGDQFNSLVESLARVTGDNRLLIDRLMSVQEAERKEIAHELHDEIGPSLFGIRADSALIRRLAASGDGHAAEIGDRAAAITGLADGLQRATYRMLDTLRPLLLEELGLADALAALGRDWSERRPDLTITTAIPRQLAPLPEPAALAIYRAAQECLTNAIRHGSATRISIELQSGAATRLTVQDNGSGLPQPFRYGFGLLGMNERVRRLGGSLNVQSSLGGGTLVTIALPHVAPGAS